MACTRPHDLVMVAKRELPERELRAALAHIDACADCSAESKRLDSIFARFSALREKPVEASGDFAWRVRGALIAANPGLLQRRSPAPKRPLVPTWALAGVFAALMIATVSVFMITDDPGKAGNRTHVVSVVTPTPTHAPSAFLSPVPGSSDFARTLHNALVTGQSSSRFEAESLRDARRRFDFAGSRLGAVRASSFEVTLAGGNVVEVTCTFDGVVKVEEKK